MVVDGITVADSTRALRVLETAGAPVYYVPRDDIRMELLEPSSHTTYCEWKGAAGYHTLTRRGPADRRCRVVLPAAESGLRRDPRPPGVLRREGR